MHRVRSVLNWIVQINFGLKPKFGLKLISRHFIFRINFGFKPNFGFNFGLKLQFKRKIK